MSPRIDVFLPALAALFFTSTLTAARAQTGERAVVWMRFVDAQKNPVAGVELKLRVQDRRESLGKCGADGALVLDMPWTWPGEEHGFEAIAEAVGFQLETVSGKLLRGVELDLGDVVLEPGASVTGRVVDREGKPVAGATVRAMPERYDGRPVKRGAIVTSADENGRYQLIGLAPGKCRLWARHERTRWKSLPEIEVKAGDALRDQDFLVEALPDDQIVSGVVVDPSGQPVAGAELRTQIKEPDGPAFLPAKAITDEQGRFVLYLPDRPESAFFIDVEDPSRRFGELTYDGAVPGDRDVRIALPAITTIALEVKDSSGNPIEEFGWSVRFQRARGGTTEDVPAERHAGGKASVRAPARSFSLIVSSRLHAPKELGPYDPKSLPTTIAATLDPLPAVSGRVVAGGKPVAGAFVQVVRNEGNALAATKIAGYAQLVNGLRGMYATTDERGEFQVPVQASMGEIRIRAWARGWCEGLSAPVRTGARDVSIELGAGGSVEGKVALPDGADPTGILVELYRERASAEFGTSKTQRFRARVGDDDTYKVEHLAPGPWLARLVFPPARRQGDVETLALPVACSVDGEKSTRRDIDRRVPTACTVDGTLQVNGKPSRQGAIRLYTTTSPALVVDATELDEDGSFRLRAGEPGRYRVVWTGGANALSKKTVTQEIELRAGANRWEPVLAEAQWQTKERVIELDAAR